MKLSQCNIRTTYCCTIAGWQRNFNEPGLDEIKSNANVTCMQWCCADCGFNVSTGYYIPLSWVEWTKSSICYVNTSKKSSNPTRFKFFEDSTYISPLYRLLCITLCICILHMDASIVYLCKLDRARIVWP